MNSNWKKLLKSKQLGNSHPGDRKERNPNNGNGKNSKKRKRPTWKSTDNKKGKQQQQQQQQQRGRGKFEDYADGKAKVPIPSKKLKLKDPKPKVFRSKHGTNFLVPGDEEFGRCLKTSYIGFVHERADTALSKQLRTKVNQALSVMTQQHYFHYDLVQYGERVNSTKVQRTLVGEPGITYYYQKLRLFALPWNDETIANGSLLAIKQLNEALSKHNQKLLQQHSVKGGEMAASAGVGRCDFNLTLINAALTNDMPTCNNKKQQMNQKLLKFKPDKKFNLGEAAVNWHKDSTLEDFSSIAVYHHTPLDAAAKDWRIACCIDDSGANGTAPALSVPLGDEDTYFMLGNFNHHHLHAVIAGASARYASTHRVAVEKDHTWQGVLDKSTAVLEELSDRVNCDAGFVQRLGETQSLLEFDWIRQFFIQGSVHKAQHASYWLPRVEQLLAAWRTMDAALLEVLRALLRCERTTAGLSLRSFSILIYLLQSKRDKRLAWKKRYSDPNYLQLSKEYRPLEQPVCGQYLPWDLTACIEQLVVAKRRAAKLLS